MALRQFYELSDSCDSSHPLAIDIGAMILGNGLMTSTSAILPSQAMETVSYELRERLQPGAQVLK